MEVESFLTLKARKGKGAMIQFRSALYRFLEVANKTSLVDITETDAFSFFEQLEANGTRFSTKKVVRARLNTFFKGYERKARRQHPGYYNPIPPLDECNFSADVEVSISVEQQREREQKFTPEQALFILKKIWTANPVYFVATVLMVVCGMRVSECLSIRLENLRIEERYFKTGLEENARKRGKAYFCFPEEIVPLVTEYVLELKARNPASIWLFPGCNDQHRGTTSYRQFLGKLDIPFPVETHTFRKSLETYQIDGVLKVPLHFVELLSNHAITSVVMRHYAKIPIEERRALYDQYFPREYKTILAWLKTI